MPVRRSAANAVPAAGLIQPDRQPLHHQRGHRRQHQRGHGGAAQHEQRSGIGTGATVRPRHGPRRTPPSAMANACRLSKSAKAAKAATMSLLASRAATSPDASSAPSCSAKAASASNATSAEPATSQRRRHVGRSANAHSASSTRASNPPLTTPTSASAALGGGQTLAAIATCRWAYRIGACCDRADDAPALRCLPGGLQVRELLRRTR